MERIIIDTDPGVDDAHAIMMASAMAGVRIEALTAVAGNVGLDKTLANSCTILDILGEDTPVFAGCDSALVPGAEDAGHVHGEDGLGDVGFQPSKRPVEKEHASSALVRMAHESPGELTLVAIGPLTNLAVAVKLDPGLPALYKNLVIMGGAVDALGNTSNLTAEFNVYADPEAAHIVFSSWPEFTLVSWEATLAHGIPLEMFEQWQAIDSPRARFFSQISEKTVGYLTDVLGRSEIYGADGLAMAVALQPQIVRRAEQRPVMVELNGRHTRGQTTVDWSQRSGRPANANIIREVDLQQFHELMKLALT
jgi:purine nucleosidase